MKFWTDTMKRLSESERIALMNAMAKESERAIAETKSQYPGYLSASRKYFCEAVNAGTRAASLASLALMALTAARLCRATRNAAGKA